MSTLVAQAVQAASQSPPRLPYEDPSLPLSQRLAYSKVHMHPFEQLGLGPPGDPGRAAGGPYGMAPPAGVPMQVAQPDWGQPEPEP